MLKRDDFLRSLRFGFSQVVQLFVTFFSFIFIARVLTETDFGIFSTAFNLAYFFTNLLEFGIPNLIPREVARDPGRATALFVSSFYLKTILTVVSLALIFVFEPIFQISRETLFTATLLWVHFYLFTLHMVWVSYLVGLEKSDQAALTILLGKITEGLLIIGVFYGAPSIRNFAFAFILGNIPRLSLALFYCIRYSNKFEWFFNWAEIIALAQESLSFAMTTAIRAIQGKLDILILTKLTNETAVGVYYAADRLIDAARLIPRTFMTIAYPIFSSAFIESRDTLKKSVHQYANMFFLVSLPAALLIYLHSDFFIHLLYANKYAQATTVLAILSLNIVFGFFNYLYRILLWAMDQQRQLLNLETVGILIAFGLSYYLTSQYGIVGTALAKITIEFLVLFAMVIWISRIAFSPANINFLLKCALFVLISWLISYHILSSQIAQMMTFALIYTMSHYLTNTFHDLIPKKLT